MESRRGGSEETKPGSPEYQSQQVLKRYLHQGAAPTQPDHLHARGFTAVALGNVGTYQRQLPVPKKGLTCVCVWCVVCVCVTVTVTFKGLSGKVF